MRVNIIKDRTTEKNIKEILHKNQYKSYSELNEKTPNYQFFILPQKVVKNI